MAQKESKMNFLSFSRHWKVILLLVGLLPLSSSLTSCYTFTGASVPPHIKTLHIPIAEDASGFGDARYRDVLTLRLIQVFRNDNTLIVVQDKSDALLAATITAIRDETVSVAGGTSASGAELERERKAVVNVEVTYTDLVKKKQLWKKTFSQFRIYLISEGFQGRDAAIQRALQLVCDDIMLAVISGW
jgi:hypothetical protein